MTRLATDRFNAEVAVRLAAVRAASGLTQAQFAQSIGISDRSYVNYERGEREVPATVLREMLTVYGVDPAWVLTGGDDGPKYMSARQMDEATLLEIFEVVGAELKTAKRSFTFAKYARFLYLAYQHALEDGAVNSRRVRELIRLAS
jgi:transcriptional regulator with XRE-family HTH domain